MAQLIIEIPDNIANRVMDAICNNNGFTGTHNRQPETKAQFVKRWNINIIKNEVRVYETRIAQNAAEENTRNDIQTSIILT